MSLSFKRKTETKSNYSTKIKIPQYLPSSRYPKIEELVDKTKIADYYAHSNTDMQNLMEQSALVILDVDDAIANGYIKFSKGVLKLLDMSNE